MPMITATRAIILHVAALLLALAGGCATHDAGRPTSVTVPADVLQGETFAVHVTLERLSAPTWITLEWTPAENLAVGPTSVLATEPSFAVTALAASTIQQGKESTTVTVSSAGTARAATFRIDSDRATNPPSIKTAGVPVKVGLPDFQGPASNFDVEVVFDNWKSPGGWYTLDLQPARLFSVGGGANQYYANAATVKVPARTAPASAISRPELAWGTANANGRNALDGMVVLPSAAARQTQSSPPVEPMTAGVPVKVEVTPTSADEGDTVTLVIDLDYTNETDKSPISVTLEYGNSSAWVNPLASKVVDGPLTNDHRRATVTLTLADTPASGERSEGLGAWHNARGRYKSDVTSVTVRP